MYHSCKRERLSTDVNIINKKFKNVKSYFLVKLIIFFRSFEIMFCFVFDYKTKTSGSFSDKQH